MVNLKSEVDTCYEHKKSKNLQGLNFGVQYKQNN